MLYWFAKRIREREVRGDERGFTLIELLIVVIILGILAAIALPTFLAQREKAAIATCKSGTRNAAEAAVLFAAANDANNNDFSTITLAGLVAQGFNQTEGYGPTVVTELNGGTGVSLSTNCPSDASLGTTTWSTADGAFRGEVQYVSP